MAVDVLSCTVTAARGAAAAAGPGNEDIDAGGSRQDGVDTDRRRAGRGAARWRPKLVRPAPETRGRQRRGLLGGRRHQLRQNGQHPTPTNHTYIEHELDTQAAIIAEQMNIKYSIITTDTIKYVTYKTIKLIKVTYVYEVA